MQDESVRTTQASSQRLVRVERNLFERNGKFVFVTTDRKTGKQFKRTLKATTRADARVEIGELRVSLSRGEVSGLDRTLSVAALSESFLERERSALGKLSPATVELYAQVLRTHVIPALGPRTKAAELQIVHLRRMVDELVARGLAGSSIRNCVNACSAMLRHAVRDLGAITRNPCRDLERGDLPSAKRKSEPRYLSVEQVEAILKLMDPASRPVAATLFYGGLRIGEALRLRWRDIDFDGNTINVPGTKSAASSAAIPLLSRLAEELGEHRRRTLARFDLQRAVPDERVFQTASGKSPSKRNAYRAITRAAERAGLVPEGSEPVGPHDLRHSLAANSFALGLSAVEVSRLMRHADPGVTMKVYAGLLEQDGVSVIGDKLAARGASA